MQSTSSSTESVSWAQSHTTRLFDFTVDFIAILFLVGLGLLLLHMFWSVMSEMVGLGTYHNTADLADLDGDGDLDVIVHSVRTESEFTAFGGAGLWINQGDGQFVPRDLEQGGGWASAAGDVDGDGDVDLAILTGWPLRWILNQGGAQGGEPGEFRVNNSVGAPKRHNQFGSVLLADLNNDGQVDGIVVGCCGRVWTLDPDDDTPNVSWVWINEWDSRGGLAPPYDTSILSALDGLAIRAAALGDLDGDGDLDLFAAVIAPRQGRNRDPADRVLFNDGLGNFTDSGQRLGKADSTAVALGDLDGDADLDALVGTGRGAMVWINQGGAQGGQDGTFALSRQEISGGQTRAVFLSDLDGDGDLDALIAGRWQAAIWWNDGQAAFTRSSQRFHYSKRHGIAIGDFNGDGRPDVFAVEGYGHHRLWLNQGDGTFQAAGQP